MLVHRQQQRKNVFTHFFFTVAHEQAINAKRGAFLYIFSSKISSENISLHERCLPFTVHTQLSLITSSTCSSNFTTHGYATSLTTQRYAFEHAHGALVAFSYCVTMTERSEQTYCFTILWHAVRHYLNGFSSTFGDRAMVSQKVLSACATALTAVNLQSGVASNQASLRKAGNKNCKKRSDAIVLAANALPSEK